MLQDQVYCVTGLLKYFSIIHPQGIHTSEEYKVTFIANLHDNNDIYTEINLKEYKPGWKKDKPEERLYTKYIPKSNLPTQKYIFPDKRDKYIK